MRPGGPMGTRLLPPHSSASIYLAQGRDTAPICRLASDEAHEWFPNCSRRVARARWLPPRRPAGTGWHLFGFSHPELRLSLSIHYVLFSRAWSFSTEPQVYRFPELSSLIRADSLVSKKRFNLWPDILSRLNIRLSRIISRRKSECWSWV